MQDFLHKVSQSRDVWTLSAFPVHGVKGSGPGGTRQDVGKLNRRLPRRRAHETQKKNQGQKEQELEKSAEKRTLIALLEIWSGGFREAAEEEIYAGSATSKNIISAEGRV